MDTPQLVLYAILLGVVTARIQSYKSNVYEVAGVQCEDNEVVSCMLVECPEDQFCPAKDYCFNPKCVCRKGYRRVRGSCMPKHPSLHLNSKTLESAMLEIPYREAFRN